MILAFVKLHLIEISGRKRQKCLRFHLMHLKKRLIYKETLRNFLFYRFIHWTVYAFAGILISLLLDRIVFRKNKQLYITIIFL